MILIYTVRQILYQQKIIVNHLRAPTFARSESLFHFAIVCRLFNACCLLNICIWLESIIYLIYLIFISIYNNFIPTITCGREVTFDCYDAIFPYLVASFAQSWFSFEKREFSFASCTRMFVTCSYPYNAENNNIHCKAIFLHSVTAVAKLHSREKREFSFH